MTTPIVTLLLCLIQATLLVAVTVVVRWCVARKFAASRATVGAAGMTSILLVTALAFMPLPSVWPAFQPASTKVDSVLREREESTNSGGNFQSENSAQSNSSSNLAGGIEVPQLLFRFVGESLQRATVAADSTPRHWKHLLIALVPGGVAVAIVRLIFALRNVRKLHQTSKAINDERIVAMLSDLTQICGYRKRIDLLETTELTTAATCGWRQPAILLPVDWQEWSHDELAAVLAHEVAHIHRGDYLWRLLSHLSTAVHFYHPLVKVLARQLTVDQELAADQLARSLQQNEGSYLRGLAKLALRYDDSLSGARAWPSVSIMPQSSDFLARRLEMLRTKDGLKRNATSKLVSWSASFGIAATAIAVILLRGPAISAEKGAEDDAPPVRMTKREVTQVTVQANTESSDKQDKLFARDRFDPSLLPNADHGAFLIRVADLLKNPEMQPRVDKLNQSITEGLQEWTNTKGISIDLRQIEWIAGSMELIFKGPTEKSDMARMMLSSGSSMIRMSRAADWQNIILKSVPGATLETEQGHSYVQFPMIPALGPTPPCLRFPDDKTIMVYGGFVREAQRGDAETAHRVNLDRMFADHKQGQEAYSWADAWNAVDGGLVTIVCNFEKSGWSDLPDAKKEIPEFVAPLVSKSKYYSFGGDWANNCSRAGIKSRVTSSDPAAVKDMHLAAATLLNRWPDMFQDNQDVFELHSERILQIFSSVNFRPNSGSNEQHFLDATVEVPMKEGELLKLLAIPWTDVEATSE